MKYTEPNLWTALVTPLNSDFTVDFESMKKLLMEQDEANNGLLILGSTGEALNLSLEEKKHIIQFACEMNLSSPIMVGVGGHDLVETSNWISFLESFNQVQAYLMVTPLYAKPGDEGQYTWFKTLMDQSTKPVMLYNVPGRTGKELSLKAVERLNTHENFWGIKEASGSVEKFKQYHQAANNHPVFCGDDALMPEFAQAGSAGLISVASNVWPQATNLYVKQCLDNSFDAKELWQKASNSMFVASNPVPAKCFLASTGRITHPNLKLPLHHSDMVEMQKVVDANESVAQWLQDQRR